VHGMCMCINMVDQTVPHFGACMCAYVMGHPTADADDDDVAREDSLKGGC
jgi:hypothetical protein